ncbi:MAG: dienelactone hydrolase family protein [Gemmatimonadota bacterium]
MISLKAIAATMLAAAAFVACNTSPVEQSIDTQLTVSPDSVVVGVYESSPLTATVRDANGTLQQGLALQYISRDPSVASVNANGAISAMAVGATYVVATLAGRPEVRDSVRVRVHADSCTGARPDFGGMATAADRALFSYDGTAPLNLQKTVTSTLNGVEVSNISFTSPDGGVVNGMLWDPVTRQGPRPGVVLMHGLPGNETSLTWLAQIYAQSGAVVITIGAPWNRRAGPELTFTPQDRVEQIAVIKDLQRAVDVLRARPNVDGGRIAFVGFSWGGATGALFVGIERRLKAAALVVGHGGQVSHLTGPVGSKLIAHLPCARRVDWIRGMAPVEPLRYVGNANVPLLLQNARFDEYVPTYEAEELHAAAPPSRTVLWYNTGHNLGQQTAIDRHDWLVAQIGLDPR